MERREHEEVRAALSFERRTASQDTRTLSRLADNYIFNMTYMAEHETMRFNTILNFIMREGAGKLVKLTVALEYKPSENRVRLITMF